MELNFDVLPKTKLHIKGELESLFGVTRASLHAYLKNRKKPREAAAFRIQRILALLEVLVEAGKLPFKQETLDDPDRRKTAFEKLKYYVETQASN